MVSLVHEAVEVTALVAALVRGVYGQGLVLLDIGQPLPDVKFDQVSSDEIAYTSAAFRNGSLVMYSFPRLSTAPDEGCSCLFVVVEWQMFME